MMKISLFFKSYTMKACVFAIVLITASYPSYTEAGFFSGLISKFNGSTDNQIVQQAQASDEVVRNSQNMPLLESSINPDTKNIKNTAPVSIIKDSTVISANNTPLGPSDNLEKYASTEKINTYKVKKGDTIEGIAKKLGISKSVILE